MNSKTILLSGATGFLGSHIAEGLSTHNYKVIALIRNSSDLWRCKEFKNENLVFVNIDTKDFKEIIAKHNPSVFIHTAWNGVAAKGRNDWNIQIENILFTAQMITLANELGIKKIISFGSQAEYGNFNGRINEAANCNPIIPYGAAKLAALTIFKSFCESNAINWFWFRLFSLYGAREDKNWLIPSVIENAFYNKPMHLTGCEQRYDYIYSKDFTNAIVKVIETESESGIFNLTSNSSMQLKEIIEKVKNLVNPNAVFNFGALPYRPNQVMHMEGDSTKFNKQFNFEVKSDFETNIKEVLDYYLNKLKKEKIVNY